MASKQLGKLRQWAGEVMSSRDKTSVPEEIADLEHDIELRKDGIQRLCSASDDYHRLISKKKHTEAHTEADKLLPIDTLGVVMISHGEDFGEDSAFGTSLVKLGRAHCRVATLQEAYALTFHDTFIGSLRKFLDDIKDYEHQRRKLESRRLSYDAAVSKWEKLKTTKKDKERVEAEDDMERAKQRYEETTEDLHAYMKIVQDNEAHQQRELTSFLDLELNFVSEYLEVLKEVKSDWTNVSITSPTQTKPVGIPRPAKARQQSNGTHKVSHSFSSRRSHSHVVSGSSEDEGSFATAPPSRRPSHSRSDSAPKMEQSSGRRSRAASAASHKRGTSNASRPASPEDATVGSFKSKKIGGVAGWASNAVDSVRGKRKQDNKDKDNFAALQDEAAGRDSVEQEESTRGSPIIKASMPSMPSIMRRRSKPKVSETSLTSSPKIGSKTMNSSLVHGRRTVRALYDFNGATDADELAFKAGDQIVVLSEVLDGWWMGELNGRKGLFPTSYTEGSLSKPTPKSRASELPVDDDMYDTASDMDNYSTSKPLTPAETHSSPFFGGPHLPPDTASEDETDRLVSPPVNPRFSVASDSTSGSDMRPMMRRTTTETSTISSTSSISVGLSSNAMSRKAPPPPPPRRPTLSTGASGAPPPLPSRRPPSAAGSTANLSTKSSSSFSGHGNNIGVDASPFESLADLSAGCGAFEQAQFQQRGMCSNCMQVHAVV